LSRWLIAVGSAGRWRSSERAERGHGGRSRIDIAMRRPFHPDFLWVWSSFSMFGVLVAGLRDFRPACRRASTSFVTQFYLFESILRLRFDLTRDLLSHIFMPALALSLPLAGIISRF